MSQTLLTVRELSSFLCVHPQTIFRWIREGKIPFVKIIGVIRFKIEEIERWIKNSSHKPNLIIESLSKVDLSLEAYDRLFLKGGVKMSHKGKTWNYPFGSVYLRQTKLRKERWYIYYRVDKKRFREVVKGAQSRSDALKVLQVKVADAFRGKYGFKKDEKKIGFKKFADQYIEDYAKVNKRSWKTDEYMLRKVKEFFKEKSLHEIDSLMVDQFKTFLLKEGVTKSTVNRYMALLKTMFNLAVKWDYLKDNPVKVKFFSEKDNLKERILSAEEELRLLEASSSRLKSIILIALHTGMRKGEILKLKWNQLNFSKMFIEVENTKSGRSRKIPVNNYLYEELMKMKQQIGKSNFVFLNSKTGKALTDVRKSFHGAIRRSGIEWLRFHDLRHTFASRLVAAGVDLITIKELLGHHSVRITERYTHSNNEQKKNAVESLAQIEEKFPDFVHILSKKREGHSSNALFTIN